MYKIIYIILAPPTAHYQTTDAKARAISSLLEYCRGARRKTKSNDNSRVGVTTLLYVIYWLCITNQYNHYKNNFAHLLSKKSMKTKPELSFVGAEEEYAPRPLGELLRNFLSSSNEPLAVAYRKRKNRKL